MKSTAGFLSALFVALYSSVAAAGPVADAAMRAEALQAEGKNVEAMNALGEALDAMWTAMPLGFRPGGHIPYLLRWKKTQLP